MSKNLHTFLLTAAFAGLMACGGNKAAPEAAAPVADDAEMAAKKAAEAEHAEALAKKQAMMEEAAEEVEEATDGAVRPESETSEDAPE